MRSQLKAAKARRRAIRKTKAETRELTHALDRLTRLRGVRVESEHGGPEETRRAFMLAPLNTPGPLGRVWAWVRSLLPWKGGTHAKR